MMTKHSNISRIGIGASIVLASVFIFGAVRAVAPQPLEAVVTCTWTTVDINNTSDCDDTQSNGDDVTVDCEICTDGTPTNTCPDAPAPTSTQCPSNETGTATVTYSYDSSCNLLTNYDYSGCQATQVQCDSPHVYDNYYGACVCPNSVDPYGTGNYHPLNQDGTAFWDWDTCLYDIPNNCLTGTQNYTCTTGYDQLGNPVSGTYQTCNWSICSTVDPSLNTDNCTENFSTQLCLGTQVHHGSTATIGISAPNAWQLSPDGQTGSGTGSVTVSPDTINGTTYTLTASNCQNPTYTNSVTGTGSSITLFGGEQATITATCNAIVQNSSYTLTNSGTVTVTKGQNDVPAQEVITKTISQ